MTYALVQSTEGSRLTGGQRSISATYGSPVTTGHLLVAVVSRTTAGNDIATAATVSDGTNKWRQTTETITANGLQGVDIWICESATASTPTVTALLADFPPYTTTGLNIWIAEYSGNSGFELLDQFGNGTGTTTSLTVTTAFNLVGSHDLALSVVTGNMTAATVPSGFTSRLADATQQFWIADNVDTGTSAGSTLSAAWTGLTAGTVTTGIIVTFQETGVTASSPHLLQSSYLEPVPVGTVPPPATIASQAYPVNPAVGSTLVAFITGASYVNYHVTGGSTVIVTDTAGNVWNKMADFGTPDQNQGLNWSVWLCRSAKGGATTLTCTWAPIIQTPAWLLLEFASMPPLSIDSVGSFIFLTPRSVSTSGSVQAGDMGFAAFGQFPLRPFSLNSGWVTVGSDTAGGNCLQMYLGTPAGTLTATTGTVGVGVCSAMVCGLRLSPGVI